MSKGHDPLNLDNVQALRTEKAKSKDLERENEAEDLRWLMSQKQGRRLMFRILSICGVYRSSFTGNSETFFREGMRNVGLTLTADLQQHTPEGFISMLQEHKDGRPGDT